MKIIRRIYFESFEHLKDWYKKNGNTKEEDIEIINIEINQKDGSYWLYYYDYDMQLTNHKLK